MSDTPLSLDVHTSDLLVERAVGVTTITINRPEEQNRLTPDALAKLELVAAELREEQNVQAVIITGAGGQFFSSGILNPALRASHSKDAIIAIVRLANRVFDDLDALPQIVIAALNGPARAGGAELALASDIRLAADHTTISFPEAAWGGFPGAGGPSRLASIVGRGIALEMICSGREVDSLELNRLGLVQGVYPAGHLVAAANDLALRIAGVGPLATRGAKRIIRARLEPGAQSARELADALRRELEWSHDVDESIAAHRESRKPRFIGR